MKKWNFKVIVTLALAGLLVACTNPSTNMAGENKKGLTYSNLMDKASQEEVSQIMESAKIPSENIDSFFNDVDSFNDMVEGKSLVKSGFITIDSLEPEYDEDTMYNMWEAKSPEFMGYNCRITTYDVMRDLITIGNPETNNTDWLVFDEDAIENNPKELFTPSEHEEFLSLYAYIPTEITKDITVHVKKVQEDWKNKKIEFKNKDESSVISVFFHDELGYLFIGHIGILMPMEDGELLFLEKLSFQAPYQAIKFKNRIDLNDYLMNKYDISQDQPTAKPFIMENDQFLDGYRENPNNQESHSN